MRKSMLSLVGQERGGEARKVLQEGLELVATMSDGDTKKDEEDAMQEMAEKIDSLA
jgi:hypothetical protein